ncbi:MAG: hydrogenase [archaeon GW2011_AR13]|nr:MAG: hydrogenase [archaeon GW2011_AR13]HIG94668.1 hypothetical protein [Nanoarchaeota archaeon]HIH63464.1 hypothetical protein [Nanoarchaeota archaeon]HIJ09394.1 hypothetical protein [Nanoarchaeota archaeon]
MQKILLKENLNELIKTWIKKYEIIAPVKESKISRFKKINSPNEIYDCLLTDIPAKTHFMPEGETLLEHKDKKTIEIEGKIKKTILFGLRKCDLNAIQVVDKVMFDKNYINKRKNTTLVGFFCENPDKYCFCNSMELQDFYDLYFYPQGKNYIISIGSKKGEELVKHLPELKKEIKIPNPKNFKKLNTLDIEKYYRDERWKADVRKCLSCTACTAYCPTCNCFDIKELINSDIKTIQSKRFHSSCMSKNFSLVAGGKSFRDSRTSRFKHFVFHKVLYFKKQKGRPMCIGCGRCLRVCPTKIDWVNTINKMNRKPLFNFSRFSFKKLKETNK